MKMLKPKACLMYPWIAEEMHMEAVFIYPGLIQLEKRHIGRAAEVLTESFFHDEFYQHVFPDVEIRRKVLPVIYSTITGLFASRGLAYATSEAMEGVMLAREDETGFGPFSFLRMLKMLSVLRHADLFKTLKRARPFRAIWEGLNDFFKTYKGFVWLDMIAVDPAHRGQGHMGRMMRALLADADEKKTFCMLETETPGNVPIYQHYDFHVVKTGVVEPQGVPYYFMVYDPLGIVRD